MLKLFCQAAVVLSLITVSTWGRAQTENPVQSPALKVGDSWLFDDVVERGATDYSETRRNIVIERFGDTTMTVGVKHDGAPTAFEDHIFGIDWSQSLFLDGHEVVTGKPLVFPLNIGRKWSVDFVDPTRRGNQISVHVRRTYSAVGWEDITVPAGRFHAIKIIGDGFDEGMIETPASAGASAFASNGGTVSVSHAQRGGLSKLVRVVRSETYYVPTIKNSVRTIDEQYNSDNVLVYRFTRTLIKFAPSI